MRLPGGTSGITVITIRNEYSDPSSNTGQGSLYFT